MSRTMFENVWGPGDGTRREANEGLVGWLESTRVRLPLKAIQVSFKVQGCLAEVCVKQVFFQENKRPVDCQYQFPLPADGVVFGCEIRIGDRNLIAKVRERGEAIRLAEQHKEAGHRTLLVESERANLFTMELGNLQFQDLAEVSLRYMQPLRRVGKEWSLEVPLTPGVRYISGQPLARPQCGHGSSPDTSSVADASRISPIRIDQFHPDAAWFDLEGFLDSDLINKGTLRSPSHSIESEARGEDTRVALQRSDEFPDRDLVVRWMEPDSEGRRSCAWMEEREGVEYGLVELWAPVLGTRERSEPMDIYFLLDASGSMAGLKWEKAVEAVRAAVGMLGQADRMNLYRFSSACSRCLEEPKGRDILLESDRFESLLTEVPSGGTELFRALKTVLADSASAPGGRRQAIVLITDGQVGNEPQVLKWLRERRSPPIHSFGIDLSTNDGFLVPLAEMSGGSFHSLRPQDDIADILAHTSGVFASPVVSNLQLSEGWELASQRVPGLYRGQVRYLGVRRKAGVKSPLGLTGRSSSGGDVRMDIETRRAVSSLPHLWFHQQQLNAAMSRMDFSSVIGCSVAANILCPLTGFVTWDEGERVARAGATLIQPSPGVAAFLGRTYYRHSTQPYWAAGADTFAVARRKWVGSSGRAGGISPRAVSLFRNGERLVDLSDQLARLSGKHSWLMMAELAPILLWIWADHAATFAKRMRWISKLLATLKKMVALYSSTNEPDLEKALAPLLQTLEQLIQEPPEPVRSRLKKALLSH